MRSTTITAFLICFVLLVVSLADCSVYTEETAYELRTKTIQYDYDYSGSYATINGYLKLTYEFNVTYFNKVNVGKEFTINVTAKDVKVDFHMSISFSFSGISGDIVIDANSVLKLGLLKTSSFTVSIQASLDVLGQPVNLSVTVYGYLEATTFIMGRIIANGTAIPPEQAIDKNVTWFDENSTQMLMFNATNLGKMSLDIENLRAFILPYGLTVEKIVVHDVPVIGDVEIPLNYKIGLLGTSKTGWTLKDQQGEEYPLGDISIAIKVTRPLLEFLIPLMIIVVIIIVFTVVYIKKKKKP